MKYNYFALLLLFLSINLTSAIGQTADEKFVISFYNIENLFDTVNSPEKRDNEFTPEGKKEWDTEKYTLKIGNLSRVISDIGQAEDLKGAPAIVGICEVENRLVIEDLVNHENISESNYKIIHKDSPDSRGIDVALLYRPEYFTPSSVKAQPLFIHNPVTGERIYSRDQLLVSGKLSGVDIHIIVNHWPSKWGGDIESQPFRLAAAQVCRHLVDSIFTIDSLANIIVMGDFNDNPNKLSITSYLKASGDQASLEKEQLYNCTYSIFQEGKGTYKYYSNWNLFDQIIISQPVLNSGNGLNLLDTKVFTSEYLFQQEGKYKGHLLRTFGGRKYLAGYSDHLPSYIIVEKQSNANN